MYVGVVCWSCECVGVMLGLGSSWVWDGCVGVTFKGGMHPNNLVLKIILIMEQVII